MRASLIASAFLAAMVLPAVSAAQESVEDRMRDALRQSVTEMRAAQDQAAQAQADLARAQADKAALQAQLDAANTRLSAEPARPAARPEETAALQARLRAAEAQAAGVQLQASRLQSSYQGMAEMARQRESERDAAASGLKQTAAALEVCKAANTKLIAVAEEILHLYESQSFRSLLLKSYEPVLGLARVKLENTVASYDDKIRDLQYVPPPTAPQHPGR